MDKEATSRIEELMMPDLVDVLGFHHVPDNELTVPVVAADGDIPIIPHRQLAEWLGAWLLVARGEGTRGSTVICKVSVGTLVRFTNICDSNDPMAIVARVWIDVSVDVRVLENPPAIPLPDLADELDTIVIVERQSIHSSVEEHLDGAVRILHEPSSVRREQDVGLGELAPELVHMFKHPRIQ